MNDPLVIGLCAGGLIMLGGYIGYTQTEQPIPPAPLPDSYIDYEAERCSTLKQEPDFTYSVEKQTVSFVIECRPEIMTYFFEAVE